MVRYHLKCCVIVNALIECKIAFFKVVRQSLKSFYSRCYSWCDYYLCIVQVCGRRGCWLHLTTWHGAAPRQVNHRGKYLQRVTKIFAAVRFSEELLDKEVRESVALGKMYRELQRHVNCWDRSKVTTFLSHLYPWMSMAAVMIRVIQKMPCFMTMESLSYGNKTEAAEF